MNVITLKKVHYNNWFLLFVFLTVSQSRKFSFIAHLLVKPSNFVQLVYDWLFTFCLKNHFATFSIRSHLSINLTQNLRRSLPFRMLCFPNCRSTCSQHGFGASHRVPVSDEEEQRQRGRTVKLPTGAAELSIRQRNKVDEVSWGFDRFFSGTQLSRVWCRKTYYIPYHAFPRICSWLYKMTYRSVHGCNEVFGVQDYHIADTGWLKRDRKSAMCCLFFFYEITFDNYVYSLIGPPRSITKTRLGEDENGFLYFPVLRFIFNVAGFQASGAFHC